MNTGNTRLETLLLNSSESFSSLFSPAIDWDKIFVFDFTSANRNLRESLNLQSELTRYITDTMQFNGKSVGIGRYNEDRVIYKHSQLFGVERTIHLGIDIMLPAGTRVYSPLDSVVHSFQDNIGIGDYGPTIILQHELLGMVFYTLYGHLNRESLLGKTEGEKIDIGTRIGEIGTPGVNGNWFEHLHFQIIADMGGRKGDFPGVSSLADRESFLFLCPDPNLILGIKKFGTQFATSRFPQSF